MAKIAELLLERKSCVEKAQAITNGLASKDGADIPSADVEKEFNELIARVKEIDSDTTRLKSMQDAGAQLQALAAKGLRVAVTAAGLQVAAVRRLRIGRVALGPLPAGQWRYLGSDERF